MVVQLNQKVTAEHLKRNAYLYVRQSTMRQVIEHQESTRRQYALKQRIESLGWKGGQVIVIDNDLGQSGACADNRKGFQRLVSEVGMGHAGIVVGLEVSRLARNNSDWHRLLEICGLSDTLILDEDGLYNPCEFNDRLLLGLKGTMSEAELHILKARMQGGIMSKARRGELKVRLPTGFVYNSDDQVVLDPDKQVQHCLRLFFEIYRRTGSGRAVMMYFRKQQILFPRRARGREGKDALVWKPLDYARALDILHNPCYAGAFAFGRKRSRRYADGRTGCVQNPRQEWYVLLRHHHEGYISWEEYERNQQQMSRWNVLHGGDGSHCKPPREGPALLQGVAVCGICGRRMGVRYHKLACGELAPGYVCAGEQVCTGASMCQYIPGKGVDAAIAKLLLEAVTPLTLEVALEVQAELQRRVEETNKIRKQQLERAQYEAELARRRYMHVDPDNRLVADSLETEWNEKLNAVQNAQQEYERQCQIDRLRIDDRKRTEIMSLATDFPRL